MSVCIHVTWLLQLTWSVPAERKRNTLWVSFPSVETDIEISVPEQVVCPIINITTLYIVSQIVCQHFLRVMWPVPLSFHLYPLSFHHLIYDRSADWVYDPTVMKLLSFSICVPSFSLHGEVALCPQLLWITVKEYVRFGPTTWRRSWRGYDMSSENTTTLPWWVMLVEGQKLSCMSRFLLCTTSSCLSFYRTPSFQAW